MLDILVVGQMLRLGDRDRLADDAALSAARSRSGDAAQKLKTYVTCHTRTRAHQSAWRRLKSRLRVALICLCGLAAVFGALAALSAFSSSVEASSTSSAVNVFWLLGCLLGVNVVSLVLWALVMWRTPMPSFSFLGALTSIHRLLAKKAADEGFVIRAYNETHLSGWQGRWRLSAISHGIWLIYLLFGLGACVVLLSIQSFNFVWETTLLGPDSAVTLIQTLGRPIALMGWPVPNEAAIRSAQSIAGAASQAGSAATWAKFCLAAIVVYGVIPRAILWAISLVLLRRRERSASLPISEPYFAGILAQIYQPLIQSTVIDPDDGPVAPRKDVRTAIVTAARDRKDGAIVIGWEVDSHAVQGGRGQSAGGCFETPEALSAAVQDAAGKPVVLIVSALNTPDRGVEMALEPLRALAPGQKTAQIIDGGALKARSSTADVQRRVGDWWALLTKLGFDQSAIEIDEEATP